MTTTAEPTATRRPGKPSPDSFRPVMRQGWRDLLFLHWRVDPQELAAALPAGLDVDTHEGVAYVGLVPFRVERARLPGLPPLPFGSTFGEVNVRTYVRGPGGQPGVWFFSLDADSRLAVESARLLYRLPYHSADVRVSGGEQIQFSARRRHGGARCRVVWRPAPGPGEAVAPGSLDEFLVERYVLFAEHDGCLFHAQVFHEDYPVVTADLVELEDELVRLAGVGVVGEPSVHASPGVAVEISAPEPVAV